MSYEIPLEWGKIREFAIATKSTDPAYRAGPASVVTPTFLTTAQLNWVSGETVAPEPLDLDFTRVLHAEEEFVFHGPPPRAGQTLTVDFRVGDRYEKTGRRGGQMRFVVLVNEFRDAAGALVAEQRTTLVETEATPKAEPEGTTEVGA
jgi:hypothetical protein